MAYYVYMMTNKYRNVLYTGVTGDLRRRVWEHRNHLIREENVLRLIITVMLCH